MRNKAIGLLLLLGLTMPLAACGFGGGEGGEGGEGVEETTGEEEEDDD